MIYQARSWITEWVEGLGAIALLAKETFASVFQMRVTWRDLLAQVYFMGVKSQPVVIITGAFIGMVFSAQTAIQFHKVKMDTATLAAVSVAMCTELGPVLTGLMVAGRVGAAIAAEIGTMRVTEQIDALRTLATHPVDYLVAPRLMAGLLALPLLTAEATFLGISAGFGVAVFLYGIDATYLWVNMLKHTADSDVAIGLIKAVAYGGLLALVGCYKGMTCGEGAEGVGKATTEAVVYSSIGILILDFFLTLPLDAFFNGV
ncbi:MAG TPA: ABC transporter permease [Verrucomicrobiae bacterium]|nr:ABC transporter permease [Verrucomicrobiae bacterium]